MSTQVRIFSVLALLILALAACVPAPTPQVVEKVVTQEVEVEKEVVVTATPEPGEVTIRVWAIMAGPEAEMLDQLSRNFEETHPNVTVEFVPYTYEDMQKVYALALESGVEALAGVIARGGSVPTYPMRASSSPSTPLPSVATTASISSRSRAP